MQLSRLIIMARNPRHFHFIILALALFVYGFLAFQQLDLPGLHHDEAQEAGLIGMQLAKGYPPTLFRDTAWVVNNRAFPIMVQDYIGSLNVYLAWLSFGIGGVSVASLRTMTVLTGMLTLVIAYGAANQLAGRRTAALTLLLLAIQPTFIFWTRQGVLVTSYTLTLGLAAMWLLVRWWQGGRSWTLILAGFLLGVGLWGKLLFIWLIGGLGGAWLILNVPHLWGWVRRQNTFRPTTATALWVIPAAILAGLLGLYPLLEYNLQSGGTFESVFGNLDQSYYGVDNSDVGANFRERLRQTPIVFESGHLREYGGLYHNPIARWWFYLAILGCIGGVWISPHQRGVRLFMLLLVGLMIAQSSFTATALWFTHFALILPFMVMLGVIGILAWGDIFKRVGVHNSAFLQIFVVIMIVFELLTVFKYHHALGETGGLATYSDSIYTLVDYLDENEQGKPIAALDWGIGRVVEMLTEGRVIPNEIFGYAWKADDGFGARLQPYLALDESLYIFHAESQTVFLRRDEFFRWAEEAGRKPVLEHVLYDRQGNAYFEIWRAEK